MDGMIEFPLLRPDELANEACAAMERQDSETALRLWAALREYSPDHPEANIWPIPLLWQAGRFDEAEAMAASSRQKLPDHPEVVVQWAWIPASQGRWAEAAERWAAVRDHAPERVEGYVWGTQALWQLGRFDEADMVASEGLRRFPDDFRMMAEYGWVASARQDWPEALRRWSLVNETHPGRADAQARLAQALRIVGRTDDSETVAAAGLAGHPDDTELLIEHIWAAIARADWPEAAARLDTAQQKATNPSRIAESLGPLEAQIRDRAAGREAAGQAGDDNLSPNDLMLRFESLGERCDFGAVQRYHGVEPLGLLRFAWSKLESLVAALEDRFDAVGTVDDTVFSKYGEETIVWMRKYDLIFHTFVEGVDALSSERQEAFYAQQRRRLLFLKDKLIRDLEEPEKIWVYATTDFASDSEMMRLFAALRAYGPSKLLYVRPELPDRPAGTVEQVEDGLYAGYFHGVTNFINGGQPPFDLWLELCRKTYGLADAGV